LTTLLFPIMMAKNFAGPSLVWILILRNFAKNCKKRVSQQLYGTVNPGSPIGAAGGSLLRAATIGCAGSASGGGMPELASDMAGLHRSGGRYVTVKHWRFLIQVALGRIRGVNGFAALKLPRATALAEWMKLPPCSLKRCTARRTRQLLVGYCCCHSRRLCC